MKRLFTTLLFISFLFTLLISGCGDDETVPKIELQDAASTMTEGSVLTVLFSKALPNNVTPYFTLTGTASENIDYTYSITPNGLVFTAPDDAKYDADETIVITLTGFDGKATVGTKTVHTITVKDFDQDADPGLRINLSWNEVTGPPGVDMDLFLWRENPPQSNEFEFVDGAFTEGFTFETIFLPGNSSNGIYALGYNYYSGASNNLLVKADFKSIKGNINGGGNTASYSAVYTQANVNPWDITEEYYVVQAFEKSGNNYINFTEIVVPESGSRSKGFKYDFKNRIPKRK